MGRAHSKVAFRTRQAGEWPFRWAGGVGEDGLESTTQRAVQRASTALRCLPFRRAFYQHLESRALGSQDLAQSVLRTAAPVEPHPGQPNQSNPNGQPSTPGEPLCFSPVGAYAAEGHFIWLIQLGVLRREVDGQGLTERVRLTPLGRQVLQRWPGEIPRANPGLRVWGWLRRHRPRL